MSYDYSKLSGRIREKFKTQRAFSDAVGLSERSLSLKLNGEVGWKQAEIDSSCVLLGIPWSEIPDYFFSIKVQY